MLNTGSAVIGAMFMCASSGALAQTAAPSAIVSANPAPVLAVQRPVEVVSGSSLPSNSEVWMTMDHEVSSKKMKVGQKFDLHVSRDVMLGNYVVIPRNTPASGLVTYRTGKGAFGKSAKFEFDLSEVRLPQRSIPVAGHYRIEGQGNTGAAVGAAVAVGVFGAFVTGRSAVAAQGSEWKASTKEPIVLSLAPTIPASAPAGASPAVVTTITTPAPAAKSK